MHSTGEFNIVERNIFARTRAFEDARERSGSKSGREHRSRRRLFGVAGEGLGARPRNHRAGDPRSGANLAAGSRRMGGQVWRRRGARERPGALELQGA